MQKFLSPSLSVITTGGKKLGEILKHKKAKEVNTDSVVYRIPCGICPRVYFGETGRGLRTRIREHKADVRFHRESNAFVAHAEETGHLPNWSGAASISKDFSKTQRKIVEAAHIAMGGTINTSPGFFRLAFPVALLISREYDAFSH